jgi:hypothetical protein
MAGKILASPSVGDARPAKKNNGRVTEVTRPPHAGPCKD